MLLLQQLFFFWLFHFVSCPTTVCLSGLLLPEANINDHNIVCPALQKKVNLNYTMISVFVLTKQPATRMTGILLPFPVFLTPLSLAPVFLEIVEVAMVAVVTAIVSLTWAIPVVSTTALYMGHTWR